MREGNQENQKNFKSLKMTFILSLCNFLNYFHLSIKIVQRIANRGSLINDAKTL